MVSRHKPQTIKKPHIVLFYHYPSIKKLLDDFCKNHSTSYSELCNAVTQDIIISDRIEVNQILKESFEAMMMHEVNIHVCQYDYEYDTKDVQELENYALIKIINGTKANTQMGYLEYEPTVKISIKLCSFSISTKQQREKYERKINFFKPRILQAQKEGYSIENMEFPLHFCTFSTSSSSSSSSSSSFGTWKTWLHRGLFYVHDKLHLYKNLSPSSLFPSTFRCKGLFIMDTPYLLLRDYVKRKIIRPFRQKQRRTRNPSSRDWKTFLSSVPKSSLPFLTGKKQDLTRFVQSLPPKFQKQWLPWIKKYLPSSLLSLKAPSTHATSPQKSKKTTTHNDLDVPYIAKYELQYNFPGDGLKTDTCVKEWNGSTIYFFNSNDDAEKLKKQKKDFTAIPILDIAKLSSFLGTTKPFVDYISYSPYDHGIFNYYLQKKCFFLQSPFDHAQLTNTPLSLTDKKYNSLICWFQYLFLSKQSKQSKQRALRTKFVLSWSDVFDILPNLSLLFLSYSSSTHSFTSYAQLDDLPNTIYRGQQKWFLFPSSFNPSSTIQQCIFLEKNTDVSVNYKNKTVPLLEFKEDDVKILLPKNSSTTTNRPVVIWEWEDLGLSWQTSGTSDKDKDFVNLVRTFTKQQQVRQKMSSSSSSSSSSSLTKTQFYQSLYLKQREGIRDKGSILQSLILLARHHIGIRMKSGIVFCIEDTKKQTTQFLFRPLHTSLSFIKDTDIDIIRYNNILFFQDNKWKMNVRSLSYFDPHTFRSILKQQYGERLCSIQDLFAKKGEKEIIRLGFLHEKDDDEKEKKIYQKKQQFQKTFFGKKTKEGNNCLFDYYNRFHLLKSVVCENTSTKVQTTYRTWNSTSWFQGCPLSSSTQQHFPFLLKN